MIVIPNVRIRMLHAFLAAGVLVLAACGTADRIVAPRGVHRQAARARAELSRAGWRVTLVLPAHTTRICGDRRSQVGMSVSAVAPRVAAFAPIGHPHMTAWLFRRPQEAAACMNRFLASARDMPPAASGRLHVVHTLTAVQVVARAGRYLVIASTAGPLAPLRTAAGRALAQL